MEIVFAIQIALFSAIGLTGNLGYWVKFDLISSHDAPVVANEGLWGAVRSVRDISIVYGTATIAAISLFGLVTGAYICILASNTLAFVPVGMLGGGLAGLLAGLPVSVVGGTAIGLTFAGTEIIRHMVLRLILHFSVRLPIRYATFLDVAVEHQLLKKSGGGYAFIDHRVQEYFAAFQS